MLSLLKLFKELNEEKLSNYAEPLNRVKPVYEAKLSESGEVSVTKLPTARPGDMKPTAYIDRTRELLSKAMDKHTDELLALDRDIEKLTEERRQCRIAIDGMQAALSHMSAVDETEEQRLDREGVEAIEAAIDRRLNDGAK